MNIFSFFKKSKCEHPADKLVVPKDEDGAKVVQYIARSTTFCADCGEMICHDEPVTNMGSISDGYHTFDELYHHRAVLVATLFNRYRDWCWKSKKHHDGTMYDGMFIVGIHTPNGQATYHCDIEPYWDLFNIQELEFAPEWDGHTSADAIERIQSLMEVDYDNSAIGTISTSEAMITNTNNKCCSKKKCLFCKVRRYFVHK